MLMTIALNENLKVITGDIGNTYVHADCGATLVIKKALYGLATSGRQ